MRHVIFLDKKIDKQEFETWKTEDTAFWHKLIGITPTYWTIDYDFSTYPVEPDWEGDAMPTNQFLKELTDEVYTKYSADGTDFIMLLVHQDNWQSSGTLYNKFLELHNIPKRKGIWGNNQSNKYRNYHVQYCRWDKKNPANNFGTMYHERHHALDALIATETGFNVNTLFTVKWDKITHGEAPWTYIRYKENTDSIIKIAPYLKEALKKREERHIAYIRGKQLTIISLLEKVVYLWRLKLNKKDGVNR